MASEAKKGNAKVHFGNIFEIGTLKGAELKEGDPNRKYKGRSVFQGNKVVDENSDHALFAEMSSSPASMEAGKILDVFGSQPGYTIQQADAKQALHPGIVHRNRDLGKVTKKQVAEIMERHEGPSCSFEAGPLWAPRFRGDLGETL